MKTHNERFRGQRIAYESINRELARADSESLRKRGRAHKGSTYDERSKHKSRPRRHMLSQVTNTILYSGINCD
jgi:hypothetical protein